MLDYLKKLFGFSKAEVATPAAPYKVEATAPVVETTSVQPKAVEAPVAPKAPRAKPVAKKPAATKPKPAAKKPATANPATSKAKIRIAK